METKQVSTKATNAYTADEWNCIWSKSVAGIQLKLQQQIVQKIEQTDYYAAAVLQEQLTKVTDAFMKTNAVPADHRQELEHQLTYLLKHAKYESAAVVKEERRRLGVCHEEFFELSQGSQKSQEGRRH